MNTTDLYGHGRPEYDLTDEQYDLADRIESALEAHRGTWFTPSRLARKIKGANSGAVRTVLIWMAKSRFVAADREDFNSRTKYAAR